MRCSGNGGGVALIGLLVAGGLLVGCTGSTDVPTRGTASSAVQTQAAQNQANASSALATAAAQPTFTRGPTVTAAPSGTAAANATATAAAPATATAGAAATATASARPSSTPGSSVLYSSSFTGRGTRANSAGDFFTTTYDVSGRAQGVATFSPDVVGQPVQFSVTGMNIASRPQLRVKDPNGNVVFTSFNLSSSGPILSGVGFTPTMNGLYFFSVVDTGVTPAGVTYVIFVTQ